MLTWILLIVIVAIIAAVLAFKSMGDFQETPAKFSQRYSLFLIHKPEALTNELINELWKKALPSRQILAFERLFKGDKEALVVFGPINLLLAYSEVLGLLELEDYSKQKRIAEGQKQSILAWEVGTKNSPYDLVILKNFRSFVPKLMPHEEFWWQMVLQPLNSGWEEALGKSVFSLQEKTSKRSKNKTDELKAKEKMSKFQAMMRAIVWTEDKKRAQELEDELSKIGKEEGLVVLPQAYSSEQMVQFYQGRVLPIFISHRFSKKGNLLILSAPEIRSLLDLG